MVLIRSVLAIVSIVVAITTAAVDVIITVTSVPIVGVITGTVVQIDIVLTFVLRSGSCCVGRGGQSAGPCFCGVLFISKSPRGVSRFSLAGKIVVSKRSVVLSLRVRGENRGGDKRGRVSRSSSRRAIRGWRNTAASLGARAGSARTRGRTRGSDRRRRR